MGGMNDEAGSVFPGGNAANNEEMRRILNLLDEIARFAEHSSLTGAMKGGGRQAVRQYNALVGHLQQNTTFPPYLLVTVEEDAPIDEVGVAARMLHSYLKPDEREQAVDMFGRLSGIGDLKEVKELKEIGKRIREQVPDWMKGRAVQTEEDERSDDPADIETRLAQIGAEIESVSRQLREGNLSDGERADLAGRLSTLSREQARLEVRQESSKR